MTVDLVTLTSGDWQALYRDGVLLRQNHALVLGRTLADVEGMSTFRRHAMDGEVCVKHYGGRLPDRFDAIDPSHLVRR